VSPIRRVVVGYDAEGRSTVVADGSPPAVYRFRSIRAGGAGLGGDEPPGPGECVLAELWRADAPPDSRPEDPVEVRELLDVECRPGEIRHRYVMLGPDRFTPMHRTHTLDCDVVVAGQVELLLEDGAVLLAAGDVVILPGATHGWQTGAEGCTMSVTMVGFAEGATPGTGGPAVSCRDG
jgi:quercetin dioxygenase-like cupin family protein